LTIFDRILANDMGQTIQLLKTKQEVNSNAILIFTVVTIIFLPLSFVTSYLIMISTNNIQLLYWEIALPITFAISGLALVVAFCGGVMRDRLSKRRFRRQRREKTD
jgi:cytochrome bd-type quinol oxidase subunit 2